MRENWLLPVWYAFRLRAPLWTIHYDDMFLKMTTSIYVYAVHMSVDVKIHTYHNRLCDQWEWSPSSRHSYFIIFEKDRFARSQTRVFTWARTAGLTHTRTRAHNVSLYFWFRILGRRRSGILYRCITVASCVVARCRCDRIVSHLSVDVSAVNVMITITWNNPVLRIVLFLSFFLRASARRVSDKAKAAGPQTRNTATRLTRVLVCTRMLCVSK